MLARRSLLLAAALAQKDGLWDWPCGSAPIFIDCGTDVTGTTAARYEAWHVGAGMLDVARAVELAKKLKKR